MQTLHLKVDPNKPNPKIIEIAATLIREGETVAFPTETVYGVGTNGLDEKAVQRVFAAKGCKNWQPRTSVRHAPRRSRVVIPKTALNRKNLFWAA
jgi:L-threonylcarbamoyladenylate synthase